MGGCQFYIQEFLGITEQKKSHILCRPRLKAV